MEKLYYCVSCINNSQINNKRVENKMFTYMSVNNGFIDFKNSQTDHSKCPHCGDSTVELSLTIDDWNILKDISTDADFILEMDKLKKTDIVDFNLKLSQFKANAAASQPVAPPPQQSNVPRCPTCGSTNIKKISGVKRWFGVGTVGLASSNLGKNLECLNCHNKW